jgi:hypothetical protein
MTSGTTYIELLRMAHESLDSKDAKIAELEKELSSVIAGLFSENELAIRDLEQQAKGVSDFVYSIKGFSEGYIQALKEQE